MIFKYPGAHAMPPKRTFHRDAVVGNGHRPRLGLLRFGNYAKAVLLPTVRMAGEVKL